MGFFGLDQLDEAFPLETQEVLLGEARRGAAVAAGEDGGDLAGDQGVVAEAQPACRSDHTAILSAASRSRPPA